ncbi:tripartite tricarboxylate transporter substrate binding protein [Aquabacter sp. CN5-332]|uniref:Bug family tripartite tricarboxylate transporter substrate binding protein n=1 Tax=Aquabacter sp. CN5-332 TaxID=3156608 RepID=UPI0032B51B71
MKYNAFLKACIVGVSVVFAQLAHAETYPSRAVRLIVPHAPGGSTDVIGRTLATMLSERWKQPVVVENIVGAAAAIGTRRVAQATPDGYTLLFTYEGAHALLPYVVANPGFDALRDFTPIATAARAGFMIVVNSKLPVKTFQEFIELARKDPDQLMYGAVTGSSNHLIAEMLKIDANVKIRNVPYKGAAQALTDVVAGQIDSTVASIPSAIGYVNSGTLRALAVTGGTRSNVAPTVPTIAESGVPGFDVTHWWGVLGPAKMDPALVTKIAADVSGIAKSEEFRSVLEKQGAEPFVTTTAEFDKLLAHDIEKWGEVCKQINYQP